MTTQPRDEAGRFGPSPANVERIAALRASLAATRGFPDPWRQQLVTELALALDAAEGYLVRLQGGLLTRRGYVRAPYRHYLALADRIATIVRALGLTEKDGVNDKPLDLAQRFALSEKERYGPTD